jgi:hypothetical protein
MVSLAWFRQFYADRLRALLDAQGALEGEYRDDIQPPMLNYQFIHEGKKEIELAEVLGQSEFFINLRC